MNHKHLKLKMFDHILIGDNFRDDTNIIHLSLMEAFSNSNMGNYVIY